MAEDTLPNELKMLNADALRHYWDRGKLWWNKNRKPSKIVLDYSIVLLAWNKNIYDSNISISSQTGMKVNPYKLG